jgi:thioredoxin 1
VSISFNESNFKSAVLHADKPVLVDFSAAWCGPCRMIAPVVEKLSHDLADTHVIGTVDIDHSPILAEAFAVQSVPTLVLFHAGKAVARVSGFQSEPQLRAFLHQHAA